MFIITTMVFFFNDAATTQIYTLSLHDALPISGLRDDRARAALRRSGQRAHARRGRDDRSEEHTSELQSHVNLVCRPLLEKKKATTDGPDQGRGSQATVATPHARSRRSDSTLLP